MANKQAYIQIGNLAQMRLGKNITGDKLNRYVFNEDTPHNFGVNGSICKHFWIKT